MKKMKFLGLALVCGLLLVGCNNKKESTEQTSVETTEEPAATFEEGVLTTDNFTLTIKDKEIIKSPTTEGYGLYITYEFTNTSPENILPRDTIASCIQIEQTTETSLVILDNNYDYFDAFGGIEDTDSYNEQVDKYNLGLDELLPDKTIEVFEAYSLEDTTSPISIIAMFDGSEIGKQEIKLEDLEKPKAETNETVSANNQTSQIEESEPVQENYTEPAVQEESYEELKQRTLNSTPSERANWSNKEWEAFGMALSENGLALDDNGNIISQEEHDQNVQEETVSEEPTNLTDFVNKYGMSPAAYKMQYEGMSEEEALRSTPDEMKTSGEIQLGFSKYGI
ncbi:DUF5067 domain-containing protein [Enterococcus saccharolyticus]|uniref:DUF5067 domain-containing protein n=1 Tax=Enterococcus saccharolyticus TaxID=41997 RepID=UPI001E546FA6|nr:DUF5067 domain-containing protein [Enterococcus saccharolyticus]MCD5001220.1 DUF5067 domain-containing protein [Enterococcus saccharolyticus]